MCLNSYDRTNSQNGFSMGTLRHIWLNFMFFISFEFTASKTRSHKCLLPSPVLANTNKTMQRSWSNLARHKIFCNFKGVYSETEKNLSSSTPCGSERKSLINFPSFLTIREKQTAMTDISCSVIFLFLFRLLVIVLFVLGRFYMSREMLLLWYAHKCSLQQ